MARQHHNPAHASRAGVDSEGLRLEVERLIGKGKVKEAFKEAKLCFHQEASPENRRLVERAYLARIDGLVRGGMPSTAREVATSCLDFGVSDPELMQELILLLPQIGLADKALALQGRLQSPEAQAGLLAKLADRAVAHPEEAMGDAAVREAAGQVRSALAALDAGNESQALEKLQSIPRGSPLADWRFFVRGLAAFRRADVEQAKANWERLENHRSARKIALKLLSASGQDLNGERSKDCATLESSVFGEPVLERLGHLRNALETRDWRRALETAGTLRKILVRINPLYAQRLTECLLTPLSSEIFEQEYSSAKRMINEIKRVLEPLPWDPNWNRFQALLWEGQEDGIDKAVECWHAYLGDLVAGAPVPSGDMRLVQALVWRRIGDNFARAADQTQFGGFLGNPDDDDDDEPEIADFEGAVDAYTNSLRLDPSQRKTHEKLIELQESQGRLEGVVQALEGLLAAFPNDTDALQQLMETHQKLEQPEPVLECLDRLRKLRPLDTSQAGFEVWARLALARQLALKKRWDEAREEFTRVEQLPAESKEHLRKFTFLARLAALEFKAESTAVAEGYVEQAKGAWKDSAPVCLALAIEANRYKLPKPLQKRFAADLKSALAQKVTSAVAGELSRLMMPYVMMHIEYPCKASHVREVIKYLGRTTRLKYDEPDLRVACGLLQGSDDQDALCERLVRRGIKLFPKSPYYRLAEVDLGFRKGPFAWDLRYSKSTLDKTLALAEASQNPEDAALIPMIKESMLKIEDVKEAMNSLPFGLGGMAGNPGFMADMFHSMFGFEGDDEPLPDRMPRRKPQRKSR